MNIGWEFCKMTVTTYDRVIDQNQETHKWMSSGPGRLTKQLKIT